MSEKWVKLAEMLLDLSAQGKIDWKETAVNNAFVTSVRPYFVEIAEEEVSSNRHDYTIRVYSEDGKTLDEFNDVDLERTQAKRWEIQFNSLFKSIRRQISGADAALDAILARLEKKKSEDEMPF